MNCIICNSSMNFFFTKTFHKFGLGDVDYWKCSNCGFGASKTHYEMTDKEWSSLNSEFHSISHFAEDNPYNRNQRYFNQALMISLMEKKGLVEKGKWLDWGCGIGSVAILLQDYFQHRLLTYDKYFTPFVNSIGEEKLKQGHFDLVVNTAVFEHVRDRSTLNEIESFVSSSGCFAIHTLVPESIPQDPEWMYLLPVHCSFHTNKSMQILMEQWGYECSVYNEHAKMWILFHQPSREIGPRVARLNKSLGWDYLHFKEGFMDYWK